MKSHGRHDGVCHLQSGFHHVCLVFVLVRAASRVITQRYWCEAACCCGMDGKMSKNDEFEQPLGHV